MMPTQGHLPIASGRSLNFLKTSSVIGPSARVCRLAAAFIATVPPGAVRGIAMIASDNRLAAARRRAGVLLGERALSLAREPLFSRSLAAIDRRQSGWSEGGRGCPSHQQQQLTSPSEYLTRPYTCLADAPDKVERVRNGSATSPSGEWQFAASHGAGGFAQEKPRGGTGEKTSRSGEGGGKSVRHFSSPRQTRQPPLQAIGSAPA
ncbi:unnamed protein product [Lampetra fluviatilis]